jgi:cysteinyl-tRNA synthetase
MMVFQEIVNSVQALSIEEQDKLIELIRQQRKQQGGKEFWNSLQRIRAMLEEEGIFADENDFANLRDRSPGREVNL